MDIEYRDWLSELKSQIKKSQIKAAVSVNSQLIMLYWNLGRQIVEKQEQSKWGSKIIEQLSKDLKTEFPDVAGFSRTNLFRIIKFYKFYSQLELSLSKPIVAQPVRQIGNEIVPQPVGQINKQNNHPKLPMFAFIPWGHNALILEKVKSLNQALFYIEKTIENNWSRAVLEYQIETDLYQRKEKITTNFKLTMPEPDSDLANDIMKNEYNFDFLRLSNKVRETDLEKALIQHMAQFLTELGKGFAYMGRQYLLKVGSKEFRTDLLFYHTKLT